MRPVTSRSIFKGPFTNTPDCDNTRSFRRAWYQFGLRDIVYLVLVAAWVSYVGRHDSFVLMFAASFAAANTAAIFAWQRLKTEGLGTVAAAAIGSLTTAPVVVACLPLMRLMHPGELHLQYVSWLGFLWIAFVFGLGGIGVGFLTLFALRAAEIFRVPLWFAVLLMNLGWFAFFGYLGWKGIP